MSHGWKSSPLSKPPPQHIYFFNLEGFCVYYEHLSSLQSNYFSGRVPSSSSSLFLYPPPHFVTLGRQFTIFKLMGSGERVQGECLHFQCVRVYILQSCLLGFDCKALKESTEVPALLSTSWSTLKAHSSKPLFLGYSANGTSQGRMNLWKHHDSDVTGVSVGKMKLSDVGVTLCSSHLPRWNSNRVG